MTLYWWNVISPVTGEIMHQDYSLTLNYAVMRAKMWIEAGMHVETWSNYMRNYGC